MKASDLIHRISINSVNEISDGQGGYTNSLSEVVKVWCQVTEEKPDFSKERKNNKYLRELSINCRVNSNLDRTKVIVYQNTSFEIKMFNEDKRKGEVSFVCLEKE